MARIARQGAAEAASAGAGWGTYGFVILAVLLLAVLPF